ncbi:MAG TPA: methylenetetrahydrofolate reductase [Steroidobacteraceae bacterium]|nr:methylenetetrahydrofolate reductase [Steroidobacteraceae bacterium]
MARTLTEPPAARRAIDALLENYSFEVTARDLRALEDAAEAIPQGTKIAITFLPNEDFPARVVMAVKLRQLGFIPVPHISARRLKSQAELESFLEALQREAAIDRAFVIAGDPPQPQGPYEDALAVIRTGLLARYGIRMVGISGYPEGHSDIGNEKLWQARRDKLAAIEGQGHDFAIVTQFGFDAGPILRWLEEMRKSGVRSLIRVGVPGPASVQTLLRFAARCGVGASAKVMSKYGVSITKLLTTAGPDALIKDLARGFDPAKHGDMRLHFYPFGGLKATAEWVRDFRRAQQEGSA